MNHKWKLGTCLGIEVFVHWTFFLLLGWALLQGGLAYGLFLIAMFACVVAHEYGHVLMARHFGIGTRDITLYPIGGVASLNSLPLKPQQEMAVALAGPAVNVVISFMLLLALLLVGHWTPGLYSPTEFLVTLLIGNVVLAGFNLIPAFPMDGGRVLRAWLARTQDYATATDKAATVGQIFAFIFAGFAMVKGMFFPLILAAFIYIMASVERRQAYLEREASRFQRFSGQYPSDTETAHAATPKRDRWGNTKSSMSK